MAGLARSLAGILPSYLRIAWWGLVAPRLGEPEPAVVHQAVVLSERGVLLAVRGELRGWELPGGFARAGEPGEAAVVREVREETGLEVVVERRVGDYRRTGFLPHTARVYACRVAGGSLRPSGETPRVGWFELGSLPTTLFPWFRTPLEDALRGGGPVVRREVQGLRAVLAGMSNDLRMRLSRDRAGRIGG